MKKVMVTSAQPLRYVLGRPVTPDGAEFDLDTLDNEQQIDLDATLGITITPLDEWNKAKAVKAARAKAIDTLTAEQLAADAEAAKAAEAVAAEAAKAAKKAASAPAPAPVLAPAKTKTK